MKKMFNKMSNTVKTMTCKAHCAMTCARAHLSAPLCNTRGEGYIDTAIKILIAVHQHTQGLAHISGVEPGRDIVLHGAESVEPLLLLAAGDGIVHFGRRRTGPGREDEGEQGVEFHLPHQLHRLHGLRLRLAGEADDDIRGQHQIGHDLPGIGDQLQILGPVIGPVHGPQHPVAAGLHRQVQLVGHVPAPGHGVKQLGGGVLGLGGHEADQMLRMGLHPL